ncbi:ribose-5-phosphate isomerase [Desulfocurvibacter africanus PCS]|uniref:Ribose-5-phosphate isomerase A n=1 Tax=Desulfocurvibacter africanus PCS TaxID=1262666 RepID=M5Q169_DESAF|nr:ribose-5-phosphate isomerase RpiA [Desulfocurvibacter africanus]EMG36293.1 ribose-5-phosphate isomerase [Desulfocurvibacter africanus PCS]
MRVVGPEDKYKRLAAEMAVERVSDGMVVGLGHGSTAAYAVLRMAVLLRDGSLKDVLGVPCSRRVEEEARRLAIPLATLDARPSLDLVIDGADEIDPGLNCIKGKGGALLREKIVAQASKRRIIVADASKCSDRLGEKASLPVEVLPFALVPERRFLESLGGKIKLRPGPDGRPFVTAQGNFILDWSQPPLDNPRELARKLESRAGIMAHGLFLDIVDEVIVAGPQGLRVLRRAERSSPSQGNHALA